MSPWTISGWRFAKWSPAPTDTARFEQLADSLTELGTCIKDSGAFDTLFSAIAEVQAQRTGEGEAATMLVTRGHQKLEQGEPYEAIRWFGKAIDRLVKKNLNAS